MFFTRKTLCAATLFLGLSGAAQGAAISFSGEIDLIFENITTSQLGTLSVGTQISGVIDDETFNGSISGPPGTLEFGCCIAAGGLEITNDLMLSSDEADLFNSIQSIITFTPGQTFDLVDIEGDEGDVDERVEVGISLLYADDAFSNEDPTGYPPTQDPIIAVFFILEELNDVDVYSAIGVIDSLSRENDGPKPDPDGGTVVPLPAGGFLLLSAFLGLPLLRRLRR